MSSDDRCSPSSTGTPIESHDKEQEIPSVRRPVRRSVQQGMSKQPLRPDQMTVSYDDRQAAPPEGCLMPPSPSTQGDDSPEPESPSAKYLLPPVKQEKRLQFQLHTPDPTPTGRKQIDPPQTTPTIADEKFAGGSTGGGWHTAAGAMLSPQQYDYQQPYMQQLQPQQFYMQQNHTEQYHQPQHCSQQYYPQQGQMDPRTHLELPLPSQLPFIPMSDPSLLMINDNIYFPSQPYQTLGMQYSQLPQTYLPNHFNQACAWDNPDTGLLPTQNLDSNFLSTSSGYGWLNSGSFDPPFQNDSNNKVEDSTETTQTSCDSAYYSLYNVPKGYKEHQDMMLMKPQPLDSIYAATIYSDSVGLGTTECETFIEKLVRRLVTDLDITFTDNRGAQNSCDQVVEVLAEFALKMGHDASGDELQRAMLLVHKFRVEISEHLHSELLDNDDESDYQGAETQLRSDDMPLPDKARMIQRTMIADPVEKLNLDTAGGSATGDLGQQIRSHQHSASLNDIENIDKYLSYVYKTPHYQWLLATLRCKIILTPNNHVASAIRRSVLSVLLQSRNTLNSANQHLQVVFSMQWAPQQLLGQRWRSLDPHDFCRAHCHLDHKTEVNCDSTHPSFTLGDIITITGESSEAQALTCAAYLTQTWPMTGKSILQLFEDIIVHGTKSECSIRRTDGTQVTAIQEDEQSMKVLVMGTKYAIAEVGEQLAWLGAALRCSPVEEGLACCTARICSSTGMPDNKLSMGDNTSHVNTVDPLQKLRPLHDQSSEHRLNMNYKVGSIFSFDLSFEFEYSLVPASAPGTCWQHLFQCPVVVGGFPVMRRAQSRLGLEVPLNVIGGLLGTTYVNTFRGGFFLKGYSAILYPTQVVEDAIIWHLDYSSRKSYMPYPGKGQVEHVEVNVDQLARLRHIVGWCSVAENRTGVADGIYKTRKCKLGGISTGCVLEGCALSSGNRIIGGTPYTLLHGHDSLQIRRKSYSTMLNYLSTKFVVFFDVRDRRGWLVNGVNALYHILRSSLEEDKAHSSQNQNSLFVLRPNQLAEPGDASAASAAWQFLDNRDNLFCKIALSNVIDKEPDCDGSTPPRQEYEILAHRLEQFHDALEILFNYQTQAEELCGRQKRSRATYEGWDFVDVTRRREQKPCMMKLPLEGLACVDLLRSARAITLFGNGFDELILPTSEVCCTSWQKLPKMKYYIASSSADIQKLIEEEGELDSEPREPPQLSCVGRILWYSPQASLNDCGCNTGASSMANLVQVPWPRKHRSLLKGAGGPGKLEAKSAFVFGYNGLVPWHWPEVGDPRPGPPPELEAEDSDEDSALGSSIDTSATEQSIMSSTIPRFMLDHTSGYSRFPPVEQSHNTYGDATVRGGHNIFGDSYHQIINNYQQHTTDISVQGVPESRDERKRGLADRRHVETTSKRQRLA